MSSGIPLGQMLDMLESNKGGYARTVPTPSGGVHLGGRDARCMGISPSARRNCDKVILGERSGPAPEELGRITQGTRVLLGSIGVGSFFSYSSHQTANQLAVSGAMIHALGRTTTDPFYEAMQGFTKKAKKLSKRI